MNERPGGVFAKRPLQMLFLADTSGSMAGAKMESLNLAMREAIPLLGEAADENYNVDVLVRALRFSNGARWHVEQPTRVQDFLWPELDSDGGETHTGAALCKVAEALKLENMPARGLPPVLLLMTDGLPTDDYQKGLEALFAQPWGQHAVRLGLAIGDDADVASIEKFVANPEIPVLKAQNVQDLVSKLQFLTVTAVKAVSQPSAQGPGMAIPSAGHTVSAGPGNAVF